MNKHGQALVEFVLILPVFILLIFSFIDAGRIILCKNHLEISLNNVSKMVNNDKTVDEIKKYLSNDDYNINVSVTYDEYTKITLSTKLDLITPGINKIINPNIKVERSIINEQ